MRERTKIMIEQASLDNSKLGHFNGLKMANFGSDIPSATDSEFDLDLGAVPASQFVNSRHQAIGFQIFILSLVVPFICSWIALANLNSRCPNWWARRLRFYSTGKYKGRSTTCLRIIRQLNRPFLIFTLLPVGSCRFILVTGSSDVYAFNLKAHPVLFYTMNLPPAILEFGFGEYLAHTMQDFSGLIMLLPTGQ